MKLYAKNNIVRVDDEVYFIEIVGERLRLNDKKRWGIFVDDDSFDAIKDIEISDWLLDEIFKKEKENSWIVDSLHTWASDIPYFRIEKDESGEGYRFTIGRKCLMYMGYVRELQNIYHLYSDYEDGDYLNDDIDKKLKDLFKLI